MFVCIVFATGVQYGLVFVVLLAVVTQGPDQWGAVAEGCLSRGEMSETKGKIL